MQTKIDIKEPYLSFPFPTEVIQGDSPTCVFLSRVIWMFNIGLGMVISSFEFWACLELVWYPYALGLVLEVNPEFVRMLWVWRTGCRHQGDVSACLARACSITGVPHLVTVPAPVLPSLSGNTKNTTSRCKKDVSRMIQHVYPESAWVFLSCSTESPPALTS